MEYPHDQVKVTEVDAATSSWVIPWTETDHQVDNREVGSYS